MSKLTALSLSVGVFGMLSTLMTATVWPLPVWVLFLAWASFFFVGSGLTGFVKSVACNWTGIVIATATLLSVQATGSALWLSIAVGVGSLAMVQASRLPWISATPAIVFGFAMTVGTIAATGNGITTTGIGHPALVAAVTAFVGAGFGVASEWGGSLIAKVFGSSAAPVAQPA
ncbi:DUF1097 domain-containing protein [Mycobacterium frederiksbergense]|uniref:DUF1097 domain-containing protein n=1 Tax=Mycolicibacterium frederiksbergense TaxID=117567 RepID=UPI0021F25E9C|nr:DUF1097 domain-containing protein [Mycolicibacterium frederiksbergense]MCV7044628.1 DUF1097 domain-containing protein [Mycolicibacterium frederiksbergense]